MVHKSLVRAFHFEP